MPQATYNYSSIIHTSIGNANVSIPIIDGVKETVEKVFGNVVQKALPVFKAFNVFALTVEIWLAIPPEIVNSNENELLKKIKEAESSNSKEGADKTQTDQKNDKKHTPDQEALNKLGKEAENAAKKGNPISEEEAKALDEWADEYNVDQHHKAYDGSGEHMKGGQDHTHIYNHHIPYVK